MSKKTKRTESTKSKFTYGEASISKKSANEAFVRSVKIGSESDDTLTHVLQIIDHLSANMQTFGLMDLYHASRGLELPIDRVKELWYQWCEFMESKGKVEKICGCYDDFIVRYH